VNPIDQSYGHTNLHPLGVAVVFLLALFALFLDRRKALVPLLIAACAIPMAQRLIVFGADFTMLRILIAVYLGRVIFRGEFRSTAWNRLDTAVVLWSACGTMVMFLAEGTLQALVYRLGWSFDMLGVYFVGRFLIRDWLDLKFAAIALAKLSVPVAIVFAVEWATAFNMFSIFGGVPAHTWVREGRLRCQGAFAHPILAGTFWAACLPLIWTLRRQKPRLMRLGTVASLFIVAACSSSTPILSVIVAVAGAALFPWRRYRTQMWVGLFALLASLHMVMQAPVWHLMSRLDFTGGSTGYHRYAVFDAFVRHFSKWYVSGDPDPESWGVWQMRDATNQYVVEGLNGGLLTLIAFLLILVFAFGNVGRSLKAAATTHGRDREWICWCAGVAIFVHAVTFFGVSYFGQMTVIFYLQLSLVSCVYVFAMRDARRQRGRVPSRRAHMRQSHPSAAHPTR
jgi:hypothetical protein